MRRQRLLVALLLAVGCAGLKPTAEMSEYAKEYKTQEGQQTKLRYPELVGNAEAWDAKALTAQDDKEEEAMAYYGRVAWLWWESAQLRSQAQDLDAERKQLEKDTEQVKKELAEARKREKLAKATVDRMQQIIAIESKVAADNAEVTAAREKIADALEALRLAQAVDADVHAKSTFAAAEAKLKLATEALGKNKPKDATTFAIEAKASADAAKSEAEPKYTSVAADQAKLNRQKSLFDALAVVSGAERAMVEGGVMITIVEAFSTTGVAIDPAHTASFDKIAETAKNYGEFSLVIEGHTDNKGNKTKNLQLSESRAKSVLSHLATQGVSPSRMNAVGKGSAEPVADNKTKEGRAKNRRIEILFASGQ
ncbi:OmpA family protein [Paraliomyxa miuraensis]|uniref:OmpA family protein n=1 Tax=Paraliomyxa miuraensis TaxID=376150 RepID=UPI00224F9AEC|nr:OmpA family protein [Paraliomyxa miuraensis]MCX4243855.1 OmpA family protein [Paraliomyxa miuraensis]